MDLPAQTLAGLAIAAAVLVWAGWMAFDGWRLLRGRALTGWVGSVVTSALTYAALYVTWAGWQVVQDPARASVIAAEAATHLLGLGVLGGAACALAVAAERVVRHVDREDARAAAEREAARLSDHPAPPPSG